MQVSAIPTGPAYYQPIQAAQPVAPVVRRDADADADGNAAKVRPTPPPGVGTLIDLQA